MVVYMDPLGYMGGTADSTDLQPNTGSKEMGISEIGGTLFWGPYNKDPTI